MTSEHFDDGFEPANDNRGLERLGFGVWLLCALIIGATLGALA